MRRLLAPALLLAASMLASAQPVPVHEVSITELQDGLARGAYTSVQLVESYLARIEAYDRQGPGINSIIRLNPQAMAQARALDAEREAGRLRGPLHGIPVVIKDNYNTDFMPTTGGSVALAGFVPTTNATQVDRLLDAGAIILAKTNLHEYAYGVTTISSILGQTRNPYDIRRVPGGSSGGTGAAVAASFAAVGMGSDTCGSIRIPSAFNNLVGLRPSKGLSSIYGIMPLAHTQDVAGPLARNLEDLAIVLDIVVGHDANDPATAIMQDRTAANFSQQLRATNLNGLRLGVLSDYMERADPAVRSVINDALAWYEQQGAQVVELSASSFSGLVARSGVIGHEFRTDLDAYLALFGSEAVADLDTIVEFGLYHEAVDGALSRSRAGTLNEQAYAAALAAREELRNAVEALMEQEQVEALVYPTIGELPVFAGESQPGNNCSLSANSGLPTLSIPAGFTAGGLPVGMELLGRFMQDEQLFAIAAPYERLRQPRRSPAATPALVTGEAPALDRRPFSVTAEGIEISGEMVIDSARNLLRFDVVRDETAPGEFYALTLVIDGDAFALNDPVVWNLLGPNSAGGEIEIFMSATLRAALLQERLYFKVFGEGLPTSGFSQAVPR